MGETILILGGTRSGKSRMAERLGRECSNVTYLATATVDPTDPEMTARIARHRADRPQTWSTLEVPRELEAVLPDLVGREGAVVIDCATLWITNLLLGLGGGPALTDDEVLGAAERAGRLSHGEARVIWVSNEVGLGIVPANPLARRFADLQGLVNQRLAAECEQVHFCAAGLSIRLR